MFSGINAIAFAQAFPDNESCRHVLNDLKWKHGYVCHKCGNRRYIKGRTAFHRRCSTCRYDESLTANTIFHDIRMPLKKAFHMIFRIVAKKKGMSTVELAGEVGVQQKTAWLLKRKVQRAMKGSCMELGEWMVGRQAIGCNRLEKKKRRRVQYNKARVKQLAGGQFKGLNKPVAVNHSVAGSVKNKADTIETTFINFLSPQRKWNYPGTQNQQLLFRNWLRGIHHKCSRELFYAYCDEFSYRFDRRNERKTVFERLIATMIRTSPHPYQLLKAQGA